MAVNLVEYRLRKKFGDKARALVRDLGLQMSAADIDRLLVDAYRLATGRVAIRRTGVYVTPAEHAWVRSIGEGRGLMRALLDMWGYSDCARTLDEIETGIACTEIARRRGLPTDRGIYCVSDSGELLLRDPREEDAGSHGDAQAN